MTRVGRAIHLISFCTPSSEMAFKDPPPLRFLKPWITGEGGGGCADKKKEWSIKGNPCFVWVLGLFEKNNKSMCNKVDKLNCQ